MLKHKNILLTILVLVLVFSFGAGIYAMLTDRAFADNNFTFAKDNKTTIVETFDPPKEMKPGISFTKDVKIRNVGDSSAYVRIKAVFSDSDMGKYCEINYNTTDFEYNSKDGYWYYKKALNMDETTPSLFTTVKIKDDAPKQEMKNFDILIYTESYKRGTNYQNYQEAWKDFLKNKPIGMISKKNTQSLLGGGINATA